MSILDTIANYFGYFTIDWYMNKVTMKDLNFYAKQCHTDNRKWWYKPGSHIRIDRNKGELICLMHSELSECMEGERKDLMDTHLPHRKMSEVELADVLIRIFDYSCAFGYDIEGAYQEKRLYNLKREDHKWENRMKEGGKKW